MRLRAAWVIVVVAAAAAPLAAQASRQGDGLPQNIISKPTKGDEKFTGKLKDTLEKIGKTDVGKALLRCIKERDLNVRVNEFGYSSDTQEPQAKPGLAEHELDGTGTHSDVQWDPGATITVDGMDIPPDVVLVHELAHACNQRFGLVLGSYTSSTNTTTLTKAPGCDIPAEEALAADVENAYRGERPMPFPQRKTFNGKPLAKCPPPLEITPIKADFQSMPPPKEKGETHYTVEVSGLWTLDPGHAQKKPEAMAREVKAAWTLAAALVDEPAGDPGPQPDPGCKKTATPDKKKPFEFVWYHLDRDGCDHTKQGGSGHQGIVTVTASAGPAGLWTCTTALGGTVSFDPGTRKAPKNGYPGARKSTPVTCAFGGAAIPLP